MSNRRKLSYWRIDAGPSRFHLGLLIEQPEWQPDPDASLAVFSHREPGGSVAEHVLSHLDRLKEAGLSLVFVPTSPSLMPNAGRALRSRCCLEPIRK
jgi:hypothetical protein